MWWHFPCHWVGAMAVSSLSLGWEPGGVILDTEMGTWWCLPCHHIVDMVGSSLLAFGGHGSAILVCAWGLWCHPVHSWGLWCHCGPGDPAAEWGCIKPSVPRHCGGAGGISAQPAPCPALRPHQLRPCCQPRCSVRGALCPGVGSLCPLASHRVPPAQRPQCWTGLSTLSSSSSPMVSSLTWPRPRRLSSM